MHGLEDKLPAVVGTVVQIVLVVIQVILLVPIVKQVTVELDQDVGTVSVVYFFFFINPCKLQKAFKV